MMKKKREELKYKFLLQDVPPRLILNMYNFPSKMNISQLASHTKSTYSHTTRLIDHLSKKKIIKIESQERDKIISLTDLGKKLAYHLNYIMTI